MTQVLVRLVEATVDNFRHSEVRIELMTYQIKTILDW